jgi:ribonuclease HI
VTQIELKRSEDSDKPIVEAFVAISCGGGIGGWGAVINFEDSQKERSSGRLDVTAPAMNLHAASKVLEVIFREYGKSNVHLHIDSYVAAHIELLPFWQANGWQSYSLEKISHRALWKQLDKWQSKHCNVRFTSMNLRTRANKLRKEAKRSKELAREARKRWTHLDETSSTVGVSGPSIRL